MLNIMFYENNFQTSPERSIFLAGPTSRDNVFEKSWRNEAVKLFEKFQFNGTVFIPEFSKPKQFEDSDWLKSVSWEKKCMDVATCIMFWIPRKMPDMPGLTTNLEFGYYIAKRPDNVILGFPKDADATEWITLKYSECHKTSFNKPSYTLEETVKNAIRKVNEIEFGK